MIKPLQTPQEISDLLIHTTGINIFEKTRIRNVIEHRAFFCYLLRSKLEIGPSAIAAFFRTQPRYKNYDHSTAIHACNMFNVYKSYSEKYFDDLEAIFEIKPNVKYNELPKIERLQKENASLKRKLDKQLKENECHQEEMKSYKDFKRRFNNKGWTPNEVKYRFLTTEQKNIYDKRVRIILKSFDWNKTKEKYEKIMCAE